MNAQTHSPRLPHLGSCSIVESIDRRLDEAERALPALPRQALRLTRSSIDRVVSTTQNIGDAFARRLSPVGDTASSAAATATGQARSAAGRATETATRATKESIGQTRAQTKRSLRSVNDAATALLDEGARAVGVDDAGQPAQLEEWTRGQLYDRAQQLGVPGRSSMNKAELVTALRDY